MLLTQREIPNTKINKRTKTKTKWLNKYEGNDFLIFTISRVLLFIFKHQIELGHKMVF